MTVGRAGRFATGIAYRSIGCLRFTMRATYSCVLPKSGPVFEEGLFKETGTRLCFCFVNGTSSEDLTL